MENKIDSVEIGKRLRELRGDVPRSVVARKLKISYSAMAYYESGERLPSDRVKVMLANYYGMTVQDIFFS